MFIIEIFKKCCSSETISDQMKLEVTLDHHQKRGEKQKPSEMVHIVRFIEEIQVRSPPGDQNLEEGTPKFASLGNDVSFQNDSIKEEAPEPRRNDQRDNTAIGLKSTGLFGLEGQRPGEHGVGDTPCFGKDEGVEVQESQRPRSSSKTLKLVQMGSLASFNSNREQMSPESRSKRTSCLSPTKKNEIVDLLINKDVGATESKLQLLRFPSGEIPENLHNKKMIHQEAHKRRHSQQIQLYDEALKREMKKNGKLQAISVISDELIALTRNQSNRANTFQLLKGKSLSQIATKAAQKQANMRSKRASFKLNVFSDPQKARNGLSDKTIVTNGLNSNNGATGATVHPRNSLFSSDTREKPIIHLLPMETKSKAPKEVSRGKRKSSNGQKNK